ncbi:uncharacterized protein LAJ45_01975 [Morchella importuna]|uniref:uncharacterized protein n=1 Tax=Morchella importuna TaxID=1174673 RepID=UPI001E8DA87D|nr:uncharacterized protein LAJ45_01975 [Morchella importuna]KAH8154207.1 hypothetical protein LAJ45_01975 [Morchella importuna]
MPPPPPPLPHRSTQSLVCCAALGWQPPPLGSAPRNALGTSDSTKRANRKKERFTGYRQPRISACMSSFITRWPSRHLSVYLATM